MPKLTPWFEPGVKPARVGVYEIYCRETTTKFFYSYFDGKAWRGGWYTPQFAYEKREHELRFLNFQAWRGLTKEAK